MNAYIKIEGLQFGYAKDEYVLNNLNMNIPKGSIYGFLGENGAGKTTTLKLLMSLIHGYKGQISIEGKDIKNAYPSYLKKVGSLIESPSLYSHLSAVDNLRIWCKYFNADAGRIPELLHLLDLSTVSRKRTIQFSTGMKQRLGIAIALLHDPNLLILDEPTNGLDPMGLIDLFDMLQRLNDDGKTIVISSHILTQLEKIVSHLGIIKQGSLVFEGTMDELELQKERNVVYEITTENAKSCLALLPKYDVTILDASIIRIKLDAKLEIAMVINLLVNNGIEIYEVLQIRQDLESLFINISKENKL